MQKVHLSWKCKRAQVFNFSNDTTKINNSKTGTNKSISTPEHCTGCMLVCKSSYMFRHWTCAMCMFFFFFFNMGCYFNGSLHFLLGLFLIQVFILRRVRPVASPPWERTGSSQPFLFWSGQVRSAFPLVLQTHFSTLQALCAPLCQLFCTYTHLPLQLQNI